MTGRNINKEKFKELQNIRDKIQFCLEYAVLAPSTHNTQPWLFKITGNSCKVYYNPALKLPKADATNRNLYISLGKAIENLILAARYFGIYEDTVYRVDQEPNLAAEVLFEENKPRALELEKIVDAMVTRVNIRGPFLPRTIDRQTLAEVQNIFESEYKSHGISLSLISDREDIKKIAKLTEEGMHMAHKDDDFRAEMSKWIKNSLTRDKDGMPGYSMRMPFILSFIIPTLIRYKDLGSLLGILNYKSVSTASNIFIFNADNPGPVAWLEMGRGVERLSLELQVRGVVTSVYVASVEMGDLYKQVQAITGTISIPQFVFCAGYMNHKQKPTPKHTVEEKLIE